MQSQQPPSYHSYTDVSVDQVGYPHPALLRVELMGIGSADIAQLLFAYVASRELFGAVSRIYKLRQPHVKTICHDKFQHRSFFLRRSLL